MAKHNEIGQLGEQLAAHFLRANGYTVKARNWRWKRAEIDIIAEQEQTLIFVEVKTRSSDQFGTPEMAISKRKERLIAAAATAYMEQTGHEWALRFDIVSVQLRVGEAPEINHFEDAFFPGLH